MTAPAAIVLAAGEGRRMGGPKALLVVDGLTLVRAHVQRLREVGCRPIVVVVRTGIAAEVGAALSRTSGVRIVSTNTDSMAESLTAGLNRVIPEPNRVIVVALIDALPAQRSTLRALLSAAATEDFRVATPHYRGRGGHPVALREELMQPFREGYPGTLRDLVRSAEEHRCRVEVDDPAVAVDLDTPADLATLSPGAVPHFATSRSMSPFERSRGALSDRPNHGSPAGWANVALSQQAVPRTQP